MRIIPILAPILLAACATAPRPAPRASIQSPTYCTAWCTDTVAPGVVWRQATLTLPDSTPQTVLVNVLDVDLANPAVRIRPVRAWDSVYHTVVDMGDSTAGAVAGVNGGFFLNKGSDDICRACDTGSCPAFRASSLLQIADSMFSTNCRTARSAFGIDAAGDVHFSIAPANMHWANMPYAVGAGPTLVSGGQAVPLTDSTMLFPWIGSAHARTAVALDGRGHLLLVTIDVPGLTLPGLANFLIDSLDAREAMNLDGGGSTTMWVRDRGIGGLANCPSSSANCGQRRVYDGLYVLMN